MERQYHTPDDEFNVLLAKVIREINLKLGSRWAFEHLLDSVFDSLGVLIPFDRIGLALLEEDGKRLRLKWVRSKMPINALKKGYSAPVAGSSLKGLIETGMPRIINDLLEYQKEHPQSKSTALIIQDGIRSSLTCPLRANGKAVGVVYFSSRWAFTYSEAHVEIFSSIAAELSVLVEQARLRDFFSQIESRDMAIAKVLHDLRSPVSIIQGYLDLATDQSWYETLPDKFKEICEVLRKNATSMIALLDEVSDLKKIKTHGERELMHPKEVRCREFCVEVAADGKVLANTKEIFFDVQLAESLPPTVEMDPVGIRRILENLFTNAVKFSPRHSMIRLSVWSEGGALFFSVEDHGQGIRAEDLPKLFKQYGTTSTRPSEGERSSGLGLCISKSIVQLHGGEISVQSEFGKGSTFTFWIPLIHPQARSKSKPPH